jgi:hypothetical protein
MNKNYIIAFISKDKDIILEPLAEFTGDTMFFNSKHEATEYISRLYINSGHPDKEPFSKDDGLSIIRVQ